jgi:hypothetical protein
MPESEDESDLHACMKTEKLRIYFGNLMIPLFCKTSVGTLPGKKLMLHSYLPYISSASKKLRYFISIGTLQGACALVFLSAVLLCVIYVSTSMSKMFRVKESKSESGSKQVDIWVWVWG